MRNGSFEMNIIMIIKIWQDIPASTPSKKLSEMVLEYFQECALIVVILMESQNNGKGRLTMAWEDYSRAGTGPSGASQSRQQQRVEGLHCMYNVSVKLVHPLDQYVQLGNGSYSSPLRLEVEVKIAWKFVNQISLC